MGHPAQPSSLYIVEVRLTISPRLGGERNKVYIDVCLRFLNLSAWLFRCVLEQSCCLSVPQPFNHRSLLFFMYKVQHFCKQQTVCLPRVSLLTASTSCYELPFCPRIEHARYFSDLPWKNASSSTQIDPFPRTLIQRLMNSEHRGIVSVCEFSGSCVVWNHQGPFVVVPRAPHMLPKQFYSTVSPAPLRESYAAINYRLPYLTLMIGKTFFFCLFVSVV